MSEAATETVRGALLQRWAGVSVPDLVDHVLVTFHVPLWSCLGSIEEMVRGVFLGCGGVEEARGRRLHRAYRALKVDLEQHMIVEERVLFPMIQRLQEGTEVTTSRLHHEHGEARGWLGELRAATGGYAQALGSAPWRACWGALQELDQALEAHMTFEEVVLFPRASGAFTSV